MRAGGAGVRNLNETAANELHPLLPTPVASDRGDRSQASLEAGGGKELRAIRKLLPTPNTRDHHAQGATHNPKAHSTALSTLVEKHKLLPTPAAQEPGGTPEDHLRRKNRDGGNRKTPTHLGLLFQTMPGVSTPQPSDSGSESVESSPHDPPTKEAA